MKILIIGHGGREHAMGWALKQQNPSCQIYYTGNNVGLHQIGTSIGPYSIKHTEQWVIQNQPQLVCVGPEQPLVEGLGDSIRKHKIPFFGPNQKAAQLEGSKLFMKDIARKSNIPTSDYQELFSQQDWEKQLQDKPFPKVFKLDSLAGGKGVFICHTDEEIIQLKKEIIDQERFGPQDQIKIFYEDFIQGEEVSVFAICDGENAIVLPPCQDHKKINTGDTGENTGGMGAYCPTSILTKQEHENTLNHFFLPTLHTMKQQGIPFQGVLYAGLIKSSEGISLLEYNVRWGDPEAQVLLPWCVQNDLNLLETWIQSDQGNLKNQVYSTNLSPSFIGVVCASKGYPRSFKKGFPIQIDPQQSCQYFYSGCQYQENQIVTSGGRVLTVVSSGSNIVEGREKVYQGISKVLFEDMIFRTDIGLKELKPRS